MSIDFLAKVPTKLRLYEMNNEVGFQSQRVSDKLKIFY